MACAARAVVEVVAVVQVAARGRCTHSLRKTRDITGQLRDGRFVSERRRNGSHLGSERVGLVLAATITSVVAQLTIDVCRILAGDGGCTERRDSLALAPMASDARCEQFRAISGERSCAAHQ